jgi:hypothetical protein
MDMVTVDTNKSCEEWNGFDLVRWCQIRMVQAALNLSQLRLLVMFGSA